MILPYKHSDFEMIASWWIDHRELPPVPGQMIEDGTFILYKNNIAAMSLTILLTQSKEMAYIEGFIKNPLFKENMQDDGQKLWDHGFDFAKNRGYKRVVCYPHIDALKSLYKKFGMTSAINNISSLVKEI